MSDAPVLVFVYGTLMRGCSLHHFLSDGKFDGEASTDGLLISLGEYPGLIEGAETVRGELYEFTDLLSTLDVLDDVEEYDPASPDESEFVRDARRVRRDNGAEVWAWLYLYNQPRGTAPIIPSGDWRRQS